MLYSYQVNIAGHGHARRGIPCQDSCAVWCDDEGQIAIAAVADGLGSERCSQVGSQVAAETFVSWCREHLGACEGEQAVEAMMHEAYYACYDAVAARAAEMNEPVGEFDSTLCAAVFNGDTLFWGQAGDSGLVACLKDGTYVPVTTMQRDEQGRVFPLCFDDHWEFGHLDNVATCLLATDGVLEGMIAPPVVERFAGIPLDREKCHLFLHPQEGDAEHVDELQQQAEAFVADYPRGLIDDDKTLVVICDDTELPASQPEAYYAAPDWDEIRRKRHEAVMAAYAAEDAERAEREAEADMEGEQAEGAADAPGLPSTAADATTTSARATTSSTALDDLAETADAVADAMGDAVREAMPAWKRAVQAAAQAGRAAGDGCREMARSLHNSWRRGRDG